MKILAVCNEFVGARGKCVTCGTKIELEAGDVDIVKAAERFDGVPDAWLTACPHCSFDLKSPFILCQKPRAS